MITSGPAVAAALASDPFDVRRVLAGTGLLGEFNRAGVLTPADVHVAQRLADLGGEGDDTVRLAFALAVRAPRLGHVHVDLARIADTAVLDADETIDPVTLAWPVPAPWLERVGASELVTVERADISPGVADPDTPPATVRSLAPTPFTLIGTWLYLDRYLREERMVARHVNALSRQPAHEVSIDVLADGLARLFSDRSARSQRLAAAAAVLRRFAVVAGGPGTGKTTTVAGIVALLHEQAAAFDTPPPLVALAAPTGKAAAQLQESVHEQARRLPITEALAGELTRLRASTLHRLLGSLAPRRETMSASLTPRLPHDAVIIDETSMVSLSLMARLTSALAPHARLILVGDPGQLASIEAGAVLGDIVGPAAARLRITHRSRTQLEEVSGIAVAADDPPEGVSVAEGIIVLDRVHRFGAQIAALAAAVRRGDDDAALEVLAAQHPDVRWVDADAGDSSSSDPVAAVRAAAAPPARAMFDAAVAGDAAAALLALGHMRILCAHRHGPYGAATWNERVRGWLAAERIAGLPDGDFAASRHQVSGAPVAQLTAASLQERWYPGRPLLVTENDYELRLYNGDTGVIVQTAPSRMSGVFRRGGELVHYGPARLSAVQTVYAMTIHKSQGSQVDTAVVLLPPAGSPILTREFLYTAITRARERLLVIGLESAIRAAVRRPVARASGLTRWLWQPGR